jgi:hypothetical protein
VLEECTESTGAAQFIDADWRLHRALAHFSDDIALQALSIIVTLLFMSNNPSNESMRISGDSIYSCDSELRLGLVFITAFDTGI